MCKKTGHKITKMLLHEPIPKEKLIKGTNQNYRCPDAS